MMIRPGSTVVKEFTLRSLDSVLSNADTLPTGVLVRNGIDTDVEVEIDNKDTGIYKTTCVVPSDWVIGDIIELRVTATVSTITDTWHIYTTTLNSSTAGPGGIQDTITVLDTDNNPIAGCDVWVTSDSTGLNVIAGTSQTNISGQVTFMLESGTYYIWRQKFGYNFTNPQIRTI